MRQRTQRLMDVENFRQVRFVAAGDAVITRGDGGAIFAGDGWEAAESVEADDLSAVVVRLVDAAEGGEECKVVAPADAQFHDEAMHVDDLPVDIMHVENAA